MQQDPQASAVRQPLRKQGTRSTLLRMAVLICFMLTVVVGGAGFLIATKHQPASAASQPPMVGINLDGVDSSDPDLLFADVFMTPHYEAAPNQSGPPAVDANDWPLGDFQDFLWDGALIIHTSGTYKLKFNGIATLGLGLQNGSFNNQTYDAATNTTTVDVVLQGDSSPRLIFTNTQRTASSSTNTGVTNIQMMRPIAENSTTSYSFSTVFTSAIENFVRNFQVIRFMDYAGTNNNPQVNWSDRILPQARQAQGGRGAWEYAIQLCNETGRDGYINVPGNATDDYITHLADLIKYGSDSNGTVYTSPQSNPAHAPLNSNLHLYVEYSNEVWNGSFQQMHDNYDAAVAEVNAGGSPLNYDGETGTYQWGWRRIAKRIHDISTIFRGIFGDGAMPPNTNAQIRPIFEWQYGNAQDTANQGLSFLDNYYGNADGIQHVANPHPVNYILWGGGGAAYSNVNNPNAATVDDIYNSGYSPNTVPNTVSQDVFFIHAYGLQQDIAYEGGFQIGGDSINNVQYQANIDPRATQMELLTQTKFSQAGGDLLMYFNASSYQYGLARPTVLDGGPKLQAIQQINQSAQAAPTNGTLLPATVTLNSSSFVTGNRINTLVNSPSASTYSAVLNLQTGNNANTLQVLVNNAVVQTVHIAQTSQQTTDVTLNAISLQAGLNGISFRALNPTSTTLYSVTLANGNFTPSPGPTPPTAVPTPPTVVPTPPTAVPTPPTSGVAISAGGSGAGSFVADTDFSGGTTYTSGATIDTSAVSSPAPQAVYQSERYGNFTYTIPGLTAGASYTVRLHFAELYWTAAGKRVFNVSINGTQVISNFDIFAAAGAANKAIVQSATANANGSGQIVLQFSTVTDNAKIDGIEVIPAGTTTGGSTLFASGFEGSDPQPTWTNTVDNAGYPAGGSSNITGICCGLTGPEAGPRNELNHTGGSSLMYSGSDSSTTSSYAYMQIFDLSGKNVTVGSATTLDYWIYPQSSSSNGLVSGSNSTCVALDLIFSNGSSLRDSGATDQNGNLAHPGSQCNKLTLDTWNHVVINLGTHNNGLTVVRIDLGYDQTVNTGGYRGYVDNISIHN